MTWHLWICNLCGWEYIKRRKKDVDGSEIVKHILTNHPEYWFLCLDA